MKYLADFSKLAGSVIADWIAQIPPEVVLSYIESDKDPFEDAVKNFPNQVNMARQIIKPFLKVLPRFDARIALRKLCEVNPRSGGVILNHPRGLEWFEKILSNAKMLLSCDEVICDQCLNPFPLYPPGREEYECPYCHSVWRFWGSR
ncbi:MAG: hypothetical protein QXM02_06810 [Thermoproteota archaeon]